MLQICRFAGAFGQPRLGLLEDGRLYDLTGDADSWRRSLNSLLALSRSELLNQLAEVPRSSLPRYAFDLSPHNGRHNGQERSVDDAATAVRTPRLLKPIESQEVWAAGVTYVRSREARTEEAITKDIYARVYEAERPELFFKGWGESDRVVGPEEDVSIRGDSTWDVPEPELALILNARMEIVGITAGNDMSSRSIEGENPLYLPQAKVYQGACALGPVMTLLDGTFDPADTAIELSIARHNETVFSGQTSTREMHRTLADLVSYLGRCNTFTHGAVLLTGTGLVPPAELTLQDGDDVTITVNRVGTLHNRVRRLPVAAS